MRFIYPCIRSMIIEEFIRLLFAMIILSYLELNIYYFNLDLLRIMYDNDNVSKLKSGFINRFI